MHCVRNAKNLANNQYLLAGLQNFAVIPGTKWILVIVKTGEGTGNKITETAGITKTVDCPL